MVQNSIFNIMETNKATWHWGKALAYINLSPIAKKCSRVEKCEIHWKKAKSKKPFSSGFFRERDVRY